MTAPVLAEEPDLRRVLRRLAPFVAPHRARLAVAAVAQVAQSLAVVLFAPVIGAITDVALRRDPQVLWLPVGLLLALVLAQMVLYRVAGVLVPAAGERVVQDLRDRAVDRLAAAPLRFLERHRHGDLLRRTTAEVAEITQFVRTQAPGLVDGVLTLVLTGVVLLVYSPALTGVLLLVAAPGAILTVRWFLRGAPRAFAAAAAAEGTVAAGFTETLTVRETLREAGGVAFWSRARERENDAAVRAARRVGVVELRINGVTLVEGVTLAAMLGVGAWAVTSGWITVGTVVVFVLASRTVVTGFVDLSQQVGELQATRTALARLLDLLAVTAPPPDEPQPVAPVGAPGLVVTGLRYGYGGAASTLGPAVDVLRGIDLHAAPGERLGLVGRTGAGKSTLAKVLAGLYRPDAGTVTVNGVDPARPGGIGALTGVGPARPGGSGTDAVTLTGVGPARPRGSGADAVPVNGLEPAPDRPHGRRVVLVPQTVHLVGGTVADNLALLPGSPTRAAMERAADAAGLADWVAGLPAGLDTPVGPRGGDLSAGERQLVGLLRAALVAPDLLILDEATADVDPVTAAALERAVAADAPDRILIVIAHRPATIEALPRLVELHDGVLTDPRGAG